MNLPAPWYERPEASSEIDADYAAVKSFISGSLTKVGPEGYIHGWIKVGDPGTPEHDKALNELGGLAANHSNEAGAAVDRARAAAQEGRFAAAKSHLDNAAFLLHAAGHHNLAQAAEGARDSFTGAKPPPKSIPGHTEHVISHPVPQNARDFEAAMMMPRGTVPVGSRGGEQAVGGAVRAGTGMKAEDPLWDNTDYETQKQQIAEAQARVAMQNRIMNSWKS